MPKFLLESCLKKISKINLMFDYMFETDVYNMKIKGDEHIYMMGINLERICLYRGIPCRNHGKNGICTLIW